MAEKLDISMLGEDIGDVLDKMHEELSLKIESEEYKILHSRDQLKSLRNRAISIAKMRNAKIAKHLSCLNFDIRFHFSLIYYIQTLYETGDPLTELPQLLGHLGLLSWEEHNGSNG